MKLRNYLLCGTAALVLASCGGNARKQGAENQSVDSTAVQANSLYTLTKTVGDVQAVWIRDNAADKLMPRTLFPAAGDALIDSLGLQEGVPSSISTFLVTTGDGTRILFDAGLGAVDSRLLSGLDSAGVQPADVRYIYLTHLHGDHIGGLMTAAGAVVFPNAEVYVSKPEYDYWMADKANKQQVATMETYKERLHLFQFGDTLPGAIVALDATGHTPGHTAFRAGKLLVVGDLMHGAALQAVHPEICASFDMDTVQAVKTRRHFLQYARENGLTMAGMHLPAPAFR